MFICSKPLFFEYNKIMKVTYEERRNKVIEDRKNSMPVSNVIQNLILENREKLTITGVVDVLSFDDQIVIVETELGMLTIKGEDLRINKLSIDSSEVMIEGQIFNLGYSENTLSGKGNSSIFSKIFK